MGDVALPDGIQVISSGPSVESLGYLTIPNDNKQPVYVMSLVYKDALVMATLDANWVNRVNSAREVASNLAAANRPARLTIERLTSLDQDLKEENLSRYVSLPEYLPLPATQSSELCRYTIDR